jgi:hypothetical protein
MYSVLKQISKKAAAEGGKTFEANITALGASSTLYNITKKSGGIITNVPGPAGYSIGDTVTVIAYSGGGKRYVIVGKGSRTTIATPVKTVYV